jgi:diguanylate cyclase (GGDEF)-like protein
VHTSLTATTMHLRHTLAAVAMLVACLSQPATADDPLPGTALVLDSDTRSLDPNPAVQILSDGAPGLSLQQAMAAGGWQPLGRGKVNLGLSDRDWWLRFSVSNASAEALHPILEIAYPSLDHIALYRTRNGLVEQSFFTGDRKVFASRSIPHHLFLFPLELTAGHTQTIYINLESAGPLIAPLTLWERGAYVQKDQTHQLISGLYFGAMLIMVIYNLLIFLAVGDRAYLFHIGFVLSILMAVVSLNGYGFQFLWPNAIDWNGSSIGFFITTAVLFGLLFAIDFLNLNERHGGRFVQTIVAIGFILIGIMALAVIAAPYTLMIISIGIGATAICSGGMLLGLYTWWQGEPSARHYVAAWGAFLVCGILSAATRLSLLPRHPFTENALEIGSTLLVALLSLALAARINEERRQRSLAQLEALHSERQARQARDKALELQENTTRMLEEQVQSRTRELQNANAKLAALSTTDSLTGLRNRRFLDDALEKEFGRCQRLGTPLSLVFIDVDHFKRLNDNHGHQIGDRCLVHIADIISRNLVRPADLVARFGGEEFCLLLPDTDLDGAMVVAQRVRAAVQDDPLRIDEQDLVLTVSLGVAVSEGQNNQSPHALLRLADTALYDAKAAGRNCVMAAPPSPEEPPSD